MAHGKFVLILIKLLWLYGVNDPYVATTVVHSQKECHQKSDAWISSLRKAVNKNHNAFEVEAAVGKCQVLLLGGTPAR